MKVTINNLVEKWDKVKSHVNKATIDTYESGFEDLISMYDDPDVKEQLDLFIDDVNRQIADVDEGKQKEPSKTSNDVKKSNNEKPQGEKAVIISKINVMSTFHKESFDSYITNANEFSELLLDKGDEIIVLNEKGGIAMCACNVMVSDTKRAYCYFKLDSKYFEYGKGKSKQPKQKKEPKPKFKVVAYAQSGEQGDETFYEEEIEQKEGGYKTIAEAKKVADKFINSNKKNFDCQAVIVEVVGDTEKNVKTLSAKKVEKKQPKPKKTKQPKAKFKVGQKVVTDHSNNVYTIAEINDKGQYRLDNTSGWWSENQLSKPTKPKKEPKAKKEKQPKPKFKVGTYVKWSQGIEYIGIITDIKNENDHYSYFVEYYGGNYDSSRQKSKGYVTEVFLEKASKKEYDKAEKAYLDSKKTSVPVLPVEVSLLKRYIAINDKSVAQAKERAEGLLRAIQKAITEKRIRKESKYAEEIMTCQKSLISLLRAIDAKKLKGSDKIGIENYERCKEIVDGIKVDDVVKVSNNFISKVQEREGRKQVAENIMKKLSELNEDGENKEIVSAMKKAIQDYIDGKTEKVESVERQLRGVLGSLTKKKCCSGLGSVDDDLDAQDSTISADQLLSARFDTLPFTGRWRGFFGNPSRNFKCMLYGRAGSGKSTFAIQFAKYLSRDMGMKVLYIASEEKFGNTLQEKVKRFNVANDNISFADRLPLDITKYDVVFFDSVNDMGIEPNELMDMTANIAMVGIFQCTKDGMFRGGNDYSHDVDIVVKVDNMTALTEKNRFQAGNMEFAVI